MLEKLAENIYVKQVPLPDNPLRYINVYIITGERNLVIDTGFNRPECEAAFQEAFDELGISSADLFITHLHSDHCGLAWKFDNDDSVVYASETDGELINFETGSYYWKILDDLFVSYGFPPADFGRNTDIHPGRQYALDRRINFKYVNDGDVLEYGGYKLTCIHTPGHTPGHMCLYDRENRRLFSGDHILGLITSNITIEIGADNPLDDYRKSLERIRNLEVEHMMTTHGLPVPDMRARVDELKEHHRNRLAEVVKILGNEWKTAYKTAADMTWEIDCRNWDEFPGPQKWFATGEAISHLQYLRGIGIAERKEIDGVWHYRCMENPVTPLHF